MKISTIFVVCLVSLCEQLLSAETHVVTAWRSQWIYRGTYSGRGQQSGVRITAAPGDIIEFRQSEGKHGVFLFGTPAQQSELGLRNDFESAFELVGSRNHHPAEDNAFKRASAKSLPLFTEFRPARARGISKRKGRALLLRIRLTDEFTAPLFFGDSVVSIRDGLSAFGVVVPSPPKVLTEVPAALARRARLKTPIRSIVFPDLDAKTWLPHPIQLSRTVRFNPSRREFSLISPKGKDITASLFSQKRQSGNPKEYDWLKYHLRDLDSDGDLDCLCAIADDESKAGWSWYVLRNRQSANELRRLDALMRSRPIKAVSNETQWSEMEKLNLTSTLPGKDRIFGLVADFDRDGFNDIANLEQLAPDEKRSRYAIRLHFNGTQPASRTSSFTSTSQRWLLQKRPPYFGFIYDFDSDGWPDLVLSTSKRDAFVVFSNGGRSGFASKPTRLDLPNFEIGRIDLLDLTGDTIPDILIRPADAAHPTVVIANYGNRTFGKPIQLPTD